MFRSSLVRSLVRLALLLTLLVPVVAPPTAAAQTPLVAAEELAPWITLPPGFRATVMARMPEFRQPTSIAYGPDGGLYIAVLAGEIYRLGPDGQLTLFAADITFPLGLAWRGRDLYVAWTQRGRVSTGENCSLQDGAGQISVLRDRDGDGRADERKVVIANLPVGQGARHMVNGIAFDRQDKLYVTNGSCSNHTVVNDDPRRGTVQRYNPDGSIPADNPIPGSPVIAVGIRNPYDVAVHPVDGSILASENGRDDLGDDTPPDEIDHIIFGKGQPVRHYGWPNCYGTNGGRDCAGTQPPVVDTEPHASANGMAFYTGSAFGADYANNLFVAYYGSGNPAVRPWGKKVVRIKLSRVGETYTGVTETFGVGFERPLDVVQGPDDSLVVADFGQISAGTGVIYRITRDASASPFEAVPPPAENSKLTYVVETGHTVAADFHTFWEQRGGLMMFGFPISQEFLEDDKVVQYFERARFERAIGDRCQRPLTLDDVECQQWRVRLGLLTSEIVAGRRAEAPFQPVADPGDGSWIPETSHTLRGVFRAYYDSHGGWRVLGLPISEPFDEVNADTGATYTVQYLERARLEYHPENEAPYDILLGRLGAQVVAARYP